MENQDAWARYWRSGSLTSFGDVFSKGYEGELRELWLQFFDELPQSAVVVDLGAGNGALEEIAQKYCAESGSSLTVHAIDMSPTLPSRFKGEEVATNCEIVWHTGTRNESTGLGDRSVDAVVGNYAFEYGDDEKTIREIGRILKADGRCHFLMHHCKSTIIVGSRVELAILEEEVGKDGFFDAVRDYLREFGDIRKASEFEKLKRSGKAEPYRLRMNEAHQRALKHASTQNSIKLIQDIMTLAGRLVSPPMFFEPKQVLLKRLRELRDEYEGHCLRLRDMQRAGVSEDRMERIVGLFSEQGMTAVAEAYFVSESDIPVGWRVRVAR